MWQQLYAEHTALAGDALLASSIPPLNIASMWATQLLSCPAPSCHLGGPLPLHPVLALFSAGTDLDNRVVEFPGAFAPRIRRSLCGLIGTVFGSLKVQSAGARRSAGLEGKM